MSTEQNSQGGGSGVGREEGSNVSPGLQRAFYTVGLPATLEQAQNVVGEHPVSGEAKDAGQLPAINRLP